MFDNVLVGSDSGIEGGEAFELARLLARPGAAFTFAGIGARGLLDIGAQEEADLIVVGSDHLGLVGRAALCFRSGVVVNGAHCPVAIAPAGYRAPERLRKIGIGHNGSPEAVRGLAVARALASRNAADVQALAVVSLQSIPYGEPVPEQWPEVAADLVEAEQARIAALDGVSGRAVYGGPGTELANFSKELDLLIVGSRGLGPIGRLRTGSTSRYLVHHAACPLLIIGRGTRARLAELPARRAQAAIAQPAASEGREHRLHTGAGTGG